MGQDQSSAALAKMIPSVLVFCTTAWVSTLLLKRQDKKQQEHDQERARLLKLSSSSGSGQYNHTRDNELPADGTHNFYDKAALNYNNEGGCDRPKRQTSVGGGGDTAANYRTHCYAMKQIFSRASFDGSDEMNSFASMSSSQNQPDADRRRNYRHYDQSDSIASLATGKSWSRNTSIVEKGESEESGDSSAGASTPLDVQDSEHIDGEDSRDTMKISNNPRSNQDGREPIFEFYGDGDGVGVASPPADQHLHGKNDIEHAYGAHPLRANPLPSTSFHENRHQRALARQTYNASILPNKVIMVRHGQSAGNIAQELFSKMPDHSIPLTDFGWEQARMAGKALKESIITTDETVHFIVSPYVRTMETLHAMISNWCDPTAPEFRQISDKAERQRAWYAKLHECGVTWHEDPRIREQDFGNYQDVDLMKESKLERARFGVFYYRFQNGESGTDVFDRVSTFLDSLWRSFDTCRYQNCVLVTHGISIRVLLARYFRYSVDQFHELANPKNCEMVILNHDGSGMLRLQGRCQLQTKSTTSADGETDTKVTGYELHKALRMYHEKYISKTRRCIRISIDE
jgi:broad specificity phosphatase PhoE